MVDDQLRTSSRAGPVESKPRASGRAARKRLIHKAFPQSDGACAGARAASCAVPRGTICRIGVAVVPDRCGDFLHAGRRR